MATTTPHRTKTRITEQMARDLMAEIVTDMGRNYSADYCSYNAPDGTPNCIIGHLFHRLGITVPAHMNETRLTPNRGHFEGPHDLIEADERVVRALQTAQDVQDDRRTWGEAYDAFLKELGDE